MKMLYTYLGKVTYHIPPVGDFKSVLAFQRLNYLAVNKYLTLLTLAYFSQFLL